MYDCHVHSSFSGDSNMDPKIAINTAMKLDLKVFRLQIIWI